MILTIVGMHTQQFNRLVEAMDLIAKEIDEPVYIQIGSSTYTPRYAKHFKFMPPAKIRHVIDQADLIVSHAGVGTILEALERGRRMIVVPRLKKFKEVIDDHQFEIAEELAHTRKLTVICDVSNLPEAIQNTNKKNPNIQINSNLQDNLRTIIRGLLERKG